MTKHIKACYPTWFRNFKMLKTKAKKKQHKTWKTL